MDALQAVDNVFIRELARLSLTMGQQLKYVCVIPKDITANRGEVAQRGISMDEKSVIDLCRLQALQQIPGITTILDEIAMYRWGTLAFPGSHPTEWQSYKYLLLMDYLLSAAVCYVEVFNPSSNRVDKFFATRNRFLAGRLCGLPEADTQKYIGYLHSEYSDYQQRQLRILKLAQNKAGFRISQPRSALSFAQGVRVTPVFLIASFMNGVSEALQTQIVRFRYLKDNLQEREMVTTLNGNILLSYYDSTMVQKMLNGCSTHYDRGYIKLPELGISRYDETGVRSVNITRITSVEAVRDFDTRFIEVDFNSIIPSFYAYIDRIEFVNVLNTVYNALSGENLHFSNLYEVRTLLHSFVDGRYAIGTTTFQRQLHSFMLSQPDVFMGYDGRPRSFSGLGGNLGGFGGTGFNFGQE